MRERRGADIIVGVLAVGCLFQVGLSVMQASSEVQFHPHSSWIRGIGLPDGTGSQSSRFVSGTFFSRTGLSGVLGGAGFLFLALSLWGRYKSTAKLLLFWLAGVSFSSIFLSGSRAGILGVGAGCAFFFGLSVIILLRNRQVSGIWVALSAFFLTTIPVWIFLLFARQSFSFSLILQKITSDPYRENLWFDISPAIFKLSPIIGTGAGSFSQLSIRYRTPEFWGNPVFAHNDWLQLLLDYGLIGLSGATLLLGFHLIQGTISCLSVEHSLGRTGIFPQSKSLGYLAGGTSALVFQGAYIFFDYGLNVPAVAWIGAFFLGITGARPPLSSRLHQRGEVLQRTLAGTIISIGLLGGASISAITFFEKRQSEWDVLECENCVTDRPVEECLRLTNRALESAPEHPRLNELKGRLLLRAGLESKSVAKRMGHFRRAADCYLAALVSCPSDAELLREFGLSLSLSGRQQCALQVHASAISRDPYNALGYQYLATHYQIFGKKEEGARLNELAKRLPGKR